MNEVEKLYEMLKKVQEPKGYYFNRDKERVFELLEALLVNKNRYGYMSCPCRLASGQRESDKIASRFYVTRLRRSEEGNSYTVKRISVGFGSGRAWFVRAADSQRNPQGYCLPRFAQNP